MARTSAEEAARFEFRVWGNELSAVTARLNALSSGATEFRSNETYLLARERRDINAKMRGGVLDIKELVGVSRGCEQWFPTLKVGFPLPVRQLQEDVLPRLGLTGVALGRGEYSAAAFLEEVAKLHPLLQVTDVTKRRVKYDIPGCFAEAADVTVDGCVLHTVAVESADLDTLIAVRDQLGLRGRENVNYPRALRQLLGVEPT